MAAPLPAKPVPVKEPPRGGAPNPEAIAVMVVDDSTVIRALIAQTLRADPDIVVVATAPNGEAALHQLARHEIDVVVLDIEMPVMDGLTALPKMIAQDRDLKVIMASTLTRKNAEVSFKALSLGAADYVPKPTTAKDVGDGVDFKTDLIGKIKAHGARRRKKRDQARRPGAPRPDAPPGTARPLAMPTTPASGIALRAARIHPVAALAIGSSTGGPQALLTLVKSLPDPLKVPVFITQHMPPTFTEILAEHIGRTVRFPAAEAKDGMIVEPGRIYVAPGNFHMGVVGTGPAQPATIRLSQDAPENFCRPAVDYMVRSLVGVYGGRLLTVILTGMGQDGLAACKQAVDQGGTVIAQDEATSVVWGMPGMVATAGICSAVLALDRVGPYVAGFLQGRLP